MRELIHQLTRVHYLEGRMQLSLLTQIEGAAHPDRTGGASGPTGELKVPVDVGAMSILQDIDWHARDYHYSIFGSDTGTLPAIIQAFETVEREDWRKFLEKKLGEWANSIRSYLNPVKPPRKINQPCPACGTHLYGAEHEVALVLYCWGEDEKMLPPGEWRAQCRVCPAVWEGEQLGWLSKVLSA